MPAPIVRHGDVWQGSDFTFLDRVVRSSGTPLLIADVTSWSLRVFNRDDDRDGKTIVSSASPTGYVVDALSTADGWTKDTTGWNFKYVLPYETFKADGGRSYRFEFRFVTASYGDIYSIWKVKYLGVGSR